jgi:hydroxypyruvate isomerase
MKKLVPHAERAGVTLVFEMLNTFNHADYEAADSRYGFDLVEAIGSPSVRVLYDIYHMHRMGEDVVADIANHVDLIAHLHVAGSPGRDYPGPEQEIDYARVVRDSLAAGYRGYWGQEWLGGDDPYRALGDAVSLFEAYAG